MVSRYFEIVEQPGEADFALVCIASPTGMTGYDQGDIKQRQWLCANKPSI